ncbi:CRS2-associated factor 2, mitochondrial [Nymphaea colorata]|nr:CRS2-associated factor 2, mitochondrial [Nymphaea colorata]XP_031480486.1 CRS2-associated factor 2, mitochondrial [Nymphaea colorata]XP_031480487.1 CRS2-associated factor 2, mitochondrial [Nymphaea colorata]XP_031480488.1 CRS2-associated factor 2, mitochondrial [Nymphaea colorata]XP_031480490.1 CRS2-associated factor 2, mitochondrial [Nymphaea colorata]XP_031480491.1 CRS2-associated factor 2, mitochondrial [Nymphaea colorata]
MALKIQKKFMLSRQLSLEHLRPLITHHHCPSNLYHLQSMKQEAVVFPISDDIITDPAFSPICTMPPSEKIRKKKKSTMKDPQSLTLTNETYATKTTLASIKEPPFHSSLPFDFQYSYSETNPSMKPISFREPKFSPFGPGKLNRKWTGWSAPVIATPMGAPGSEAFNMEEWKRSVLGEPLTEREVEELFNKYGHSACMRQINLGRGGVTHNMLDDVHNHWKRAEAIRIKCLGVPTLDMDNVCFHLEDKTGGKVISRRTNILLLYRGRHYDPKKRPAIPLMLWKPHAPIYPKLVKYVPSGLTLEQTKEMRSRGLNSPALIKLTQNGVYVNVVEKVRQAFKMEEVVRLDCTYVEKNDCKKIGVKLRDLVPCVPLLFKNGQIIIWRGEGGNSIGQQMDNTVPTPSTMDNPCSS